MEQVAQAYEYKKLPIKQNGEIIRRQLRLKSPASLVIISYPKMGKTLSLVNVPKILICDAHTEVNDFADAYNYVKLTNHSSKEKFVKISSGAYIPSGIFEAVVDLRHANRMDEYWRLKNMLEERRPWEEKESIFKDLLALLDAMPFPISAWDTVTHMQELNLPAALAVYNSLVSEDKRKNNIRLVDKYGGAKYIRNNFSGIKTFIETGSPFLMWTAHVKERKAIYEKTGEEISAVDMALEGIMSTTFTAYASAVAILYRKKDGVYLDFEKRDETDLGSRCAHLADQVIRIADIRPNAQTLPKTYWDLVYPEIKFN